VFKTNIKVYFILSFGANYLAMEFIYTVPGKNGTTSILGIALTKLNKLSEFLAHFTLTFEVTEKL